MPRIQVLKSRTPCCGRLVRLRPSSEGKSYKITCPHFPDGRGMTVERVDGRLTCIWEEVEPWLVSVVLPGDFDEVEKRFYDRGEAEAYATKMRDRFPNCVTVLHEVA